MFSDYITGPVCSQMLYIQQPFGIKESACLFMGRSFEKESDLLSCGNSFSVLNILWVKSYKELL